MNDEGMAGESGAASKRRARLRMAGRAVVCTSIAALIFAAFPALAAAFAPIIVSPSATSTSGGVHLNATVYPYGLDTHYHFEYGTTTAYDTSVPIPEGDAGSTAYPGTVQVPQTVTGLALNTTYHYSLVAHNSDGTTSTTDQTFTTLGTLPGVVANAAVETVGGFELSGTVNPEGAETTYHFEYGTTTGYGTSAPTTEGNVGAGSSAEAVSQTIAGLLPNTTYHFRLAAHNSSGTASTADRTFTTQPSPPAAPSAVVSAPEAIAGGYKLKGAINPNSIATTYRFEFGTTIAYGKSFPEPPAAEAGVGEGASAVAVTQNVTGLLPNTTYHYRIVAHNSDGPGTSPDQEFTTPPNPPEVVATPFSETGGRFVLNGTVNPNGGETAYHFQFGFTTAYGSNVPAVDVGAGHGTSPVSVSQSVGGLPPNIVYHYRLVAHNAGGTSTSGDQVFTTPAAPVMFEPPAQLLAAPTPAVTPPASQFTVKPAVAKGTTATLQVNVPGPGTISASGKQLKKPTAGSHGAGTVTLKLKLTSAGLTALKKAKGHKLTVKVTITFQPTGGSPGTTSKAVTFKQ